MKYHIAMAMAPNNSSMTLPTTTPRTPNSRRGSIGWAATRACPTQAVAVGAASSGAVWAFRADG